MNKKTNKTKESKPVSKKTQEKIYFVDNECGEYDLYSEDELRSKLEDGDLDNFTKVYEVTSYKIMEVTNQPQTLRDRE